MPQKIKRVRSMDPKTELMDLCLRLQSEAEAGKLVGMAVVPFYRHGHHRKYTIALAGWASHNPTFTVGAMLTCTRIVSEIALTDAGVD